MYQIGGNPVKPKTIKLLNPENLAGYKPRNQKLMTYPYRYVGFTPQNGSRKIFRYEDFITRIPEFTMVSEINPNPQVIFIPQVYKEQEIDNISESVSLQGYPTISYMNEYFNTWLAQNGDIISLSMEQEQFNYEIDITKKTVNFGANMASSLIGLGGENAKFGQIGAGAIIEGASFGLDMAKSDKNHEFYIRQQMAQIEKQRLIPNTGNLGSSNATLLGYKLLGDSIFVHYCIKPQMAKLLDKYFDMYGYTINDLKIPNIKGRSNWNYVKTEGLNCKGDIPQNDMQEIKDIFNNGITFWHNPNTFGDYSQENN